MTTTALSNRLVCRQPKSTGALTRAWATIRLWHARSVQRAQLAELSPANLKDIGVSPSTARTEAAKPFWVA